MKKLLLASALVLVPFSSSGATYQINVAGSLDFALIGQIARFTENGNIETLGFVPIDDPSSPFYLPSFLDFSGVGSALIDTDASGSGGRGSVSNCTGILSRLCFGDFFGLDETTGTASSGGINGGGTLEFGPFSSGSVGTFSYAIDVGGAALRVGTVNFDGDFYSGGFGCGSGSEFYCEPVYLRSYEGEVFANPTATVSASYNLTTYQISAIPLPAALPLLAAGLGGLGFIGRRKKKAA